MLQAGEMSSKTLYPLIPYPQSLELLTESLELPPEFGCFYHPIFQNELRIFVDQLPAKFAAKIVSSKDDAILFLKQSPFPLEGPAAYLLHISTQQIELQANDRAGIFAALQTLRQLILAQPANRLPCLRIQDHARFAWRGFMLDEARHFQGKETVKLLLDWLAYLKMNVFHWHLSDDQGWRVESQLYPLLTEVGAYRPATQRGGMLSRKVNMQSHQGFYTRQEIQEIVAYAAERHIVVVPEIDIPGHSSAILAAYPELGCRGGPYHVQPYWGIHADILCAGQTQTIDFLEGIFGELLALFPGQFIHSGGDEAPKVRWRKCPHCIELARSLGYASVLQLQTYLANHLNHFLLAQSRTMIGWNEMLSPTLDPEVVIQYWLGKKEPMVQQIRAGRQVILSNYSTYYLDHSYTHSSLEKVYKFEPIFEELESDFHKNILGIETPLWTEFVPSRARLDWQLFPRLLAVAESAWLKAEAKDYAHFITRLESFLPQLDQAGIGYAPLEQVDSSDFLGIGAALSLMREGKGKSQSTG